MNLTHLKYAVEVAKTNSINKAAESLLMGQPNISRAIKELETSLGLTIFNRSSKGMFPTPEGENFLHYAKRILELVDELESIYKNNMHIKQHFSVSALPSIYITIAFSRFSNEICKFTDVELFYRQTQSIQTIASVLKQEFKIGIVRYVRDLSAHYQQYFNEQGLISIPITSLKYELAMNRNHPLANKPEISFEDLKPFMEIVHSDQLIPSVPNFVAKPFGSPETNRQLFTGDLSAQVALLTTNTRAFMWASPIPESVLEQYGLVRRQCVDSKNIYEDVLIHKKDYKLTELDMLFINELKKVTKFFKDEIN